MVRGGRRLRTDRWLPPISLSAIRRPRGYLRARLESQLRQDVLHVALRRALRDHELCCNLPVAHTLGHELCDLELPPAQDVPASVDAPRLTIGQLLLQAECDSPGSIETSSLRKVSPAPLASDRSTSDLFAAPGVLLHRLRHLPRYRFPHGESRPLEAGASFVVLSRRGDPGQRVEGECDGCAFVELTCETQGLLLRLLGRVGVSLQPGGHPQAPQAVRSGPWIPASLCHRQRLLIEANRSAEVTLQHLCDRQVRQGEGRHALAAVSVHLERSLEVLASPGQVTGKEPAETQVLGGKSGRLVVSNRGGQLEALLQQRPGRLGVCLAQREVARYPQSLRLDPIVGSKRLYEDRQPATPFGEVAPRFPVQPHVGGYRAADLRLPAFHTPIEGGAQVVVVAFQPLEPLGLGGVCPVLPGLLAKHGIVITVAGTQRRLTATRSKLLQAVVANALKDPVTHLGPRSDRGDHRLVHQAVEHIEHPFHLEWVSSADPLHGGQIEGAGEHRKPLPQSAFLVGGKAIAPVQRCPEGPSMRRRPPLPLPP